MRLQRPRRGESIAGLGGLILLLITFRGWFGLGDTSLTAWDLLELGRWLLLAAAIAGLAMPLVGATARRSETVFLAAARTSAVSFACAIYVTYRLVDRPDALDPRIGAFVGLVSALLVTVGSVFSMRDRIAGRSAGPLAPESTH